jgi:hypothetical protein
MTSDINFLEEEELKGPTIRLLLEEELERLRRGPITPDTSRLVEMGEEQLRRLREPTKPTVKLLGEKERERQIKIDRALEKQLRKHSTFRNPGDLFERVTPAERKELVSELLKRPSIVELFENDDVSSKRYTAGDVLEEERGVLEDAGVLADSHEHALPREDVANVLSTHEYFNEEQNEAVRYATTGRGLAILTGQAGTGKSTVLSAIREAYEISGRKVRGLAWTHEVVQALQKDAEFKEGNTAKRELIELERGEVEWDGNTVVVVDEATLVPTEVLAPLLRHARKVGAKIILAGDHRQLPSIDRGRMFEELINWCGATQLREVVRVSEPWQKEAFNLMHENKFGDALSRFDNEKCIAWRPSQAGARYALIDAWEADVKENFDDLPVALAYENRDVNFLNTEMRKRYRALCKLGDDQHYMITKITKDKNGRDQQEIIRLTFAKGDRVQYLATYKKLGIYNGRMGTVTGTTDSEITVQEDGPEPQVNRTFKIQEFHDLRHAYATTIHKAQGKTVRRSFLLYSKLWRSNLAYVAMTRHQQPPMLFVGHDQAKNIKQLAAGMSRIDDDPSAVRFLNNLDPELMKRLDNWKPENHRVDPRPLVMEGINYDPALLGGPQPGDKRQRGFEDDDGRDPKRQALGVGARKVGNPTKPDNLARKSAATEGNALNPQGRSNSAVQREAASGKLGRDPGEDPGPPRKRQALRTGARNLMGRDPANLIDLTGEAPPAGERSWDDDTGPPRKRRALGKEANGLRAGEAGNPIDLTREASEAVTRQRGGTETPKTGSHGDDSKYETCLDKLTPRELDQIEATALAQAGQPPKIGRHDDDSEYDSFLDELSPDDLNELEEILSQAGQPTSKPTRSESPGTRSANSMNGGEHAKSDPANANGGSARSARTADLYKVRPSRADRSL